MPAMLLNLLPSPLDRAHKVRFAMGGGVHSAHHAAFEQRFGVALLDGWAMTETGGSATLADWEEPRRIGRHCMGRPDRPGPPMEIRIVDDAGNEVPRGTPGNFLVRAKGPNPRKRFFSGYLKDEAATAAAWKGGWLNTGDIVREDEAGFLFFVDRKKAIVRRSGENIATAEVEEVLSTHPAVGEVSVLAVRDEIREEEVMAVIVPRPEHKPDAALADALFEHCRQRFAYYKAPGYIAFLPEMPTTATQKIKKSDLGDLAENPARYPNCFDLRARKTKPKTP
jgi:acyl-CoA synthetase (AMP-forming)/AMP-acid ligase II